jgi:hypothetical protein
MKLVTLVWLVFFSARLFQQKGDSMTDFYCNVKAFTKEERVQYNELTAKLKTARTGTRELPDGYSFQLDPKQVSLAEVAEWVADEMKCCPFFAFEIGVEGETGALTLSLKGREGIRPFIRADFTSLRFPVRSFSR